MLGSPTDHQSMKILDNNFQQFYEKIATQDSMYRAIVADVATQEMRQVYLDQQANEGIYPHAQFNLRVVGGVLERLKNTRLDHSDTQTAQLFTTELCKYTNQVLQDYQQQLQQDTRNWSKYDNDNLNTTLHHLTHVIEEQKYFFSQHANSVANPANVQDIWEQGLNSIIALNNEHYQLITSDTTTFEQVALQLSQRFQQQLETSTAQLKNGLQEDLAVLNDKLVKDFWALLHHYNNRNNLTEEQIAYNKRITELTDLKHTFDAGFQFLGFVQAMTGTCKAICAIPQVQAMLPESLTQKMPGIVELLDDSIFCLSTLGTIAYNIACWELIALSSGPFAPVIAIAGAITVLAQSFQEKQPTDQQKLATMIHRCHQETVQVVVQLLNAQTEIIVNYMQQETQLTRQLIASETTEIKRLITLYGEAILRQNAQNTQHIREGLQAIYNEVTQFYDEQRAHVRDQEIQTIELAYSKTNSLITVSKGRRIDAPHFSEARQYAMTLKEHLVTKSKLAILSGVTHDYAELTQRGCTPEGSINVLVKYIHEKVGLQLQAVSNPKIWSESMMQLLKLLYYFNTHDLQASGLDTKSYTDIEATGKKLAAFFCYIQTTPALYTTLFQQYEKAIWSVFNTIETILIAASPARNIDAIKKLICSNMLEARLLHEIIQELQQDLTVLAQQIVQARASLAEANQQLTNAQASSEQRQQAFQGLFANNIRRIRQDLKITGSMRFIPIIGHAVPITELLLGYIDTDEEVGNSFYYNAEMRNTVQLWAEARYSEGMWLVCRNSRQTKLDDLTNRHATLVTNIGIKNNGYETLLQNLSKKMSLQEFVVTYINYHINLEQRTQLRNALLAEVDAVGTPLCQALQQLDESYRLITLFSYFSFFNDPSLQTQLLQSLWNKNMLLTYLRSPACTSPRGFIYILLHHYQQSLSLHAVESFNSTRFLLKTSDNRPQNFIRLPTKQDNALSELGIDRLELLMLNADTLAEDIKQAFLSGHLFHSKRWVELTQVNVDDHALLEYCRSEETLNLYRAHLQSTESLGVNTAIAYFSTLGFNVRVWACGASSNSLINLDAVYPRLRPEEGANINLLILNRYNQVGLILETQMLYLPSCQDYARAKQAVLRTLCQANSSLKVTGYHAFDQAWAAFNQFGTYRNLTQLAANSPQHSAQETEEIIVDRGDKSWIYSQLSSLWGSGRKRSREEDAVNNQTTKQAKN